MFAATNAMEKKILFVDDEEDVRLMVKNFLGRAGFEVETKADGSFMNEIDNAAVPDMYVLDRNLNGVDALNICIRLKMHPKTKHVPVIMVSADPFIKNLYKGAGASAFIEKPFDRDSFIKTVSSCLPN